jgi:aldehyde dehydrogenase (NAD+)
MTPAEEADRILQLAGIDCGGKLVSFSPIDGKPIGRVTAGDPDRAASRAAEAFLKWRTVPAPRRGELVRLLGERLREAKPLLAKLITLESGKILQESLGEVQEMIDI